MTAHLPHFSQRLSPLKMFMDMGKTAVFVVPTRCKWKKKTNRLKWINETTILILFDYCFFSLLFMSFAICAFVWLGVSECVCWMKLQLETITITAIEANSSQSNQNKNTSTTTTNHTIIQVAWCEPPHEISMQWLANCGTHFNFVH